MQELFRRLSDPDWDDMSDYVVHFTRKTPDNDAAHNMENILLDGRIEARTKYGVGRYYPSCPNSVCLSEVPTYQLSRINRRRGAYGIGFTKAFIGGLGGGPLFYLNGDRYDAIAALMKAAGNDPNAPVWKLVSFIDHVSNTYQFDWEREWRVPADVPLKRENIRFMLIPESEHERFDAYRSRKHSEGLMPLYDCPLIDHRWPKERIRECLG